MSIVRSYSNNFEVIDRTEQLLSIPNSWDVIGRLGIFGAVEGVTTNTVSFEDIIYTLTVIYRKIIVFNPFYSHFIPSLSFNCLINSYAIAIAHSETVLVLCPIPHSFEDIIPCMADFAVS